MDFFFSIIVPYFQLMKFESKAIAATFFQKVSSVENGNVTITKFRCHCGVERTQNLKKGYQNLVSHIKLKAKSQLNCLKNLALLLTDGLKEIDTILLFLLPTHKKKNQSLLCWQY